jgi:hypothetical protein
VANFVALAATAKRLIDANGRAISIVRLSQVVSDPAKPWRGPAAPRGAAATTVPGRGAFVVLGGSGLGIKFKQDLPDSEVCLFPASDDAGQLLEDFDEIIDGPNRWKIVECQVLQPADTRLIYFFQVAR